MWSINTISKKKHGSLTLTVSIKNIANVSGTLTATPVDGSPEVVVLNPGDTYILAKEIEKGKNLNTVYTSVEVVYERRDGMYTWQMNMNRIVNRKIVENANVAYVVSFYTDGGSRVEGQEVPYGGKATRPANPTKAGKEFDGWYSDAELTTAFDFNTTIVNDIILYAKWAEPAPVLTNTLNIYNADPQESCTVNAVPFDGSETEVYTLNPGANITLAQGIPAGQAISTVYSAITANFNGSIVTVDVSIIMDENKTINVSVPHPTLGSTIRLINNSSSKSFTYVATPTDITAQIETGTVEPNGSVELSRTISEGETISNAYSSIAYTYTDSSERYVDTSITATTSAYVDVQLSDVVYVEIKNMSDTQTATLIISLNDQVTRENIVPLSSYVFSEPIPYGATINSVYDSVSYFYPNVANPIGIGWLNATDKPIIINDQITLSFSNSSENQATIVATKLDTTTETHTIDASGGSVTLNEKVALGGEINATYSSIAITYPTGTLNVDTSLVIEAPSSGDEYNFSISDDIKIAVRNASGSDSATLSYTTVGASEAETVELQASTQEYAGWNNTVKIGSALNTRFSELKYSYDSGSTWTPIDLTTVVSPATVSGGFPEYKITINNQ